VIQNPGRVFKLCQVLLVLAALKRRPPIHLEIPVLVIVIGVVALIRVVESVVAQHIKDREADLVTIVTIVLLNLTADLGGEDLTLDLIRIGPQWEPNRIETDI